MSRHMTQLSALLAQGLAACALCMAAPCQAETLEFPGSPLKRSFDGIFSSLIPDAPSSNTVIVREGAIPGRVYGGYRYGPSMILHDDGTIDLWSAANGTYGFWDAIAYSRLYKVYIIYGKMLRNRFYLVNSLSVQASFGNIGVKLKLVFYCVNELIG